MKQEAKGGLTQITWEAVVIRADGTREDLGVVAHWHKNPIRRWAWSLGRRLRRR